MTWVSHADNGTAGNNVSSNPSISADGKSVAFFSAASNLVAGDTNGVPDVFVVDLQNGSTFIAGDFNNNVLVGTSADERLFAYGGDDVLDGAAGNDTLVASGGNDTLTGGPGDDFLSGGPGNDIVNGGDGADSAAFSGLRSAYTLTALTGNGVRVAGPDGTDTVSNVETLVFDDASVTWPIPPVRLVGSPDLGSFNSAYRVVGIGDFNADGTSDILWRNPSTGHTDEWILQNGQWSRSVSFGPTTRRGIRPASAISITTASVT